MAIKLVDIRAKLGKKPLKPKVFLEKMPFYIIIIYNNLKSKSKFQKKKESFFITFPKNGCLYHAPYSKKDGKSHP